MLHIFDGPCYMKNEKYMIKHDWNHVFHVFLIFHVEISIESMQHGYSLDEEFNFHLTSTPARNLSKTLGR